MQRLNRHVTSRRQPVRGTPQSYPAAPGQVQNSAEGFVFEIDPFEQLRRFLILGTEGGTFYATESKLTKDNCKVLDACLKKDHRATVDMILDVGQNAPKIDPILFSFARACSTGTAEQRHYALSLMNDVCRTGYQLFVFIEYVRSFRGLGKGLRRALQRWYLTRNPRDVAFQITKYAQREGWTHGDILRLAHPVPPNDDMQTVFAYALKGYKSKDRKAPVLPYRMPQVADTAAQYLRVVEAAKQEVNTAKLAGLILQHRLPREVLPTESLKSPCIWRALLDAGMPMTALIRNLGTMSRIGLLSRGHWDVVDMVCQQLTNQKALNKGRIHPVSLLVAYKTYKQGHGNDGRSSWEPVSNVVNALEEAFYLSFGAIQPSGKKFMLALDYSGSMECSPITFTRKGKRHPLGITAKEAASVMAMVTARVEGCDQIYGFDRELVRLNITSTMRLEEVMKECSNWQGGSTDCAAPALFAMKHGKRFDAFIIYTDNETWHGRIHPFEALQAYRRALSPRCRQVVCGMTSTGFSIADPRDPLSLDVVGFDLDAPQAISWFVRE